MTCLSGSGRPCHADTDRINPTLREIEQMGIEERTGDVLGDNDKTDPRGKIVVAAKQQEMGHPHGPQHGNAKDAKLYSDGKCLIVRIGGSDARGTGLTGGGFFKQRADRAGPVTDHRRLPYELSRLFPEFQPFAG